MSGTRAVRARVLGRVQGVAYRMSLHAQATALGLAGWVRNRLDGRVEFVASGPADAVAALLDWAAQGPRLARVDDLQVDDEDAPPTTGFEIRY